MLDNVGRSVLNHFVADSGLPRLAAALLGFPGLPAGGLGFPGLPAASLGFPGLLAAAIRHFLTHSFNFTSLCPCKKHKAI